MDAPSSNERLSGRSESPGPHAVVVALSALIIGVFAPFAIFSIVRGTVEFVSTRWPWIVGVLVVSLALFIALSVIAVIQQREARRRETALREIAHLEQVDSMSGSEFEALTAELLKRDGYRSVRIVGRAGDRGVDVLAVAPDGRKLAVQCKRQQKTVGADRIRNLIGAVHSTYAGHVGVLVTNSAFTRHATAEAAGRLVLLDRDELARWMDGSPPQI